VLTSPVEFVPPTRAYTSLIDPGLVELPVYPGCPNVRRESDYTLPASNKTPAILTPSTSETSIAEVPFVGIKVANPIPSTTVFALVTLIESSR
jgi:hypothetical protein